MVAKKIQKYIQEHGIKQNFVAEQVGLTRQALSVMFQRDSKVDAVTYYKICKILNVPLETFLEDE